MSKYFIRGSPTGSIWYTKTGQYWISKQPIGWVLLDLGRDSDDRRLGVFGTLKQAVNYYKNNHWKDEQNDGADQHRVGP